MKSVCIKLMSVRRYADEIPMSTMPVLMLAVLPVNAAITTRVSTIVINNFEWIC